MKAFWYNFIPVHVNFLYISKDWNNQNSYTWYKTGSLIERAAIEGPLKPYLNGSIQYY